MQDFLEIILTPSFLFSIFRVTTPLLFAALGALISDRAGVINIGLEGIMLTAALFGVLGSWLTQSAWLGLLAALVASLLLASIMAYFTLHLKTNIILGGVAINIFASGITIFLLYLATGNKGVSSMIKSYVMPNIEIPLLKSIPFIGEVLSGHNILTYFCFISAFLVYILIYKTRIGLQIRAVGENIEAARSVGIPAERIQYLALLISGLLAGLGGAYMSMGYISWFAANMTAGRGFIGLAAAAMGGTPLGVTLSSLFFGFADALSNTIQSLQIPSEFVRMIPYISTIIGITIYSAKKKRSIKKEL